MRKGITFMNYFQSNFFVYYLKIFKKIYIFTIFFRTCQRIKNERFSEIVSKLLAMKNEALTQDMEVKLREGEYFALENNLKRQLAEKTMKPENIIQIRSDLEKKKAQLIYLKKNL